MDCNKNAALHGGAWRGGGRHLGVNSVHGGEVDIGEEAAAAAREQPPGRGAAQAGTRAVEEAAVQPQRQAARHSRRKRRRARHLRHLPLQILRHDPMRQDSTTQLSNGRQVRGLFAISNDET